MCYSVDELRISNQQSLDFFGFINVSNTFIFHFDIHWNSWLIILRTSSWFQSVSHTWSQQQILGLQFQEIEDFQSYSSGWNPICVRFLWLSESSSNDIFTSIDSSNPKHAIFIFNLKTIFSHDTLRLKVQIKFHLLNLIVIKWLQSTVENSDVHQSWRGLLDEGGLRVKIQSCNVWDKDNRLNNWTVRQESILNRNF